MVLTKQSLDALIKDGKASAGPDATFASSGMAVVVKTGAPKPDISTPEAFKQALLEGEGDRLFGPGGGRRQRRLSAPSSWSAWASPIR